MKMKPQVINGALHTDDRGTLIYFNDFNLKPVKRVYILEHPDISIVRAWQGHQRERKWFYVIAGAFKIILVKPDDWNRPSIDLRYEEFTMDVMQNKVLSIPIGHVNGFQGLFPGSKLMVFSDFTVKESQIDDFRFDKDLWYKW